MGTKYKSTVFGSAEDKDIEECRKEIDRLLDLLKLCKYPVDQLEFEKYKLETVKLYRLELAKRIKESSIVAPFDYNISEADMRG